MTLNAKKCIFELGMLVCRFIHKNIQFKTSNVNFVSFTTILLGNTQMNPEKQRKYMLISKLVRNNFLKKTFT